MCACVYEISLQKCVEAGGAPCWCSLTHAVETTWAKSCSESFEPYSTRCRYLSLDDVTQRVLSCSAS